MSSRLRGSDLLDTVPGRLFVARLTRNGAMHGDNRCRNAFLRSLTSHSLVSDAQTDISSYLFGNGMDTALQVDVRDPAIVATAEAVADELGSPTRDTFTSPQRHSGRVEVLVQPRVRNRPSSAEVLPDGALWTGTPLEGDVDTWTRSRSNNPEFVYELRFSPPTVKVSRIDSDGDWRRLITTHPRAGSGTLRPDWVSVAHDCDAVHLSLAGLLTAHPRLSEVHPADSVNGYGHSQSGPRAGVGDWSTVNTAWMALPRDYEWTVLRRMRDR